MAKKTLSEQIAELSKSQTEFDIEDNDLREDVFEPQDDEDDLNSGVSEDEELRKEHYVKVSKSKLRNNNDSVSLGKKYSGNVTSRSNLYGEEEDEHASSYSESEEEEEENEDGEIEGGENHSDTNSGMSLRSESESESESDEADDNEDETLNHRRSMLKELMSKERKHIVKRLSQSATNDALKGFAILQQHKLFDSIIDSRLKIQKSLTSSNLLPFNRDILVAADLPTKKTSKYLNQAQSKCYSLLDSILALRSKLLTKDAIVSEPLTNKSKKRSLADYLEENKKYDSVLSKYRSGVLNKWSAKIQNSSGSTAINASKFKAINQSSEQQVLNNLSDMDRLIKRTKLNRRQIKPLGYDYYLQQNEGKPDSADEDEKAHSNPDIPNESASNNKSNLSEINQIFDDEDFYRVLLNDLVDKKIQSSDPTSGMTITLRSVQKAQKFKKNIDTKASKGRKLRYHVQEQIANFETSRGGWQWDDDQIDEFFASLLGQKINMNEIDEVEEDVDEAEIVVGGDDSIKLFG